MALTARIELRQSAQLVMTPQLQQAIKLLTLSNLELETYVVGEIEKNPLLEPGVADDGPTATPEDATDRGEAAPAASDEPLTADRLIEIGAGEADAPLDHDLRDSFPDSEGAGGPAAGLSLNGGGGGSGGEGDEGGQGDVDALAQGFETLGEHLDAQAAAQLGGTNLAVARFLIDQIDETGYYRGDLTEAADALGVRRVSVDAILRLVQTFDPTGVGARSLSECLAIQAREAGLLDRPMSRLLKNLDLLAKGELVTLRRLCGVRGDELTALIRTLRTFNPKPGLAFGGEPAQAVQPDIYVARSPRGWSIELNGATLPRVLVNRTYYAELSRGAKGPAKTFLADCLASANWLVKALDQRARTIVKVATEIVRQQEGFFEHGVRHLRPLNLRVVAAAVGMHESTVSRVTAHKYLMCERGIFELRYFFTPALIVVGGETSVSTESVKRRLRELIAAETPDGVLSDDKLVELLHAEGLDVARRTVAKYREAMHIGSSVQRRRLLLLSA